MNTNQDTTRESRFVKVGRFLGRSSAGRLLLAVGTAALFCGAAYTAWHERELAAWCVAAWLVAYGLKLAWDLLPISEATRTRWADQSKMAQGCPAGKYRSLLWFGIVFAFVQWLGLGGNKSHGWFLYIFPGVLVVVGLVSHILCRRYVNHERKT